MLFDDWQTHKKETISKELLWEYDISSPAWDWQRMKTVVVARVLERGRVNDYYALLQLYGGKDNVREIVKQVPYLEGRDRRWACVLFDLREEELLCYTRTRSRKALLRSLPS